MPLLGKKVFNTGPVKSTSHNVNGAAKDAPYLIAHTKERFDSKIEYEKRKGLYAQNIWTCRATGHTGLTHEEACKSEKTVMEDVTSQFPKCFEKDVLTLVHHNTIGLDVIVDKAWWKINQQFIVGEKVNLKVKVADKVLPAKILSVDTSTCSDGKPSSCDSPSSDKENSSEEKDKEKSPKKWVPPKFLPYTYSIELDNDSKIIHSVPAADLQRVERSPSKDLLRLFVRVSAIRSGTAATSPWVVNSDLVTRYRLQNKFADFFFSPVKVADAMKKAEENSKKRKMSNGTPGKAAKKLKLDTSAAKDKKTGSATKNVKTKSNNKVKKKENKPTHKRSGSAKSNTSLSKNSGGKKKETSNDAVVVSSTDSEDDIPIAQLKHNDSVLEDSDSDAPLYQLANSHSKKKTSPQKKGMTTPTKKALKNSPSKKNKDKSSPAKKKSEKGDASKGKKLTGSKDSKKKIDKNVKATVKKKGDNMKQATLFDLTKKGNITPTKSVPKSAPKPPPTPAIVKRLLSMNKESDRKKYNKLMAMALRTLTPAQIKRVPEPLRIEMEHRKQVQEEKEKMAKMTPEEREAYLKEKRANAKKAQAARLLEKTRDERKRFEDTELELSPLPQATLVSTPDGFPNTLFGEVTMVTEFINCFKSILMPDSEYPIYTDALMKALVGGSSGFVYISRVLNVLLQTLLQDQMSKNCEEIHTQLSDIAVSQYTASELVRLCLRRDDEDDNDDYFDDNDVPEETVKLLEDSEFFELDVEKKLMVLRGMCLLVLCTNAVQDYMQETQGKAGELMKQRNQEAKEKANERRNEKRRSAAANEKKKTASAVDGKDESNPKEDGNNETEQEDENKTKEEESKGLKDGTQSILNFYGKDVADVSEEDSAKNWRSIVSNRRVLAAKAAEEKERKEKERAAQLEKEIEKEKEMDKRRKRQLQIDEALALAKGVLRHDPIGTDRNHDRYWLFTNTTPGLYVEKGWVGEEIHYKAPRLSKDDFSSDSEDDKPVQQTGMTPLKVVYETKRHIIEKSKPHPGQNLWFTYLSSKSLDGLVNSLHSQGIRESLLKKEIQKRYSEIQNGLIAAQRLNLSLRDSDGLKELTEGFKSELADIELRLRNGGLGGVPDFEKFEAKLADATEISDMGECLLEVREYVTDKFLQGFMKPVEKVEVKEETSHDEETDKKESNEEAKAKEKEHKQEKAMKEWREAVESCQTVSRLHVLMAILDNCIKWEKSAANAKCKICRKKSDDANLLLCDECNQAFHMYCLRPAISKLPSGDWFCPACKPRKPQTRPTELDSDSESEEEKEEVCRECGGGDGLEFTLIFCNSCPAAYHGHCHIPRIHKAPRGVWECADCRDEDTEEYCKNGGVKGKKKSSSKRAVPKRNYKQMDDATDDEDDEDVRGKKRGRSSGRAVPKRNYKQMDDATDDEDDDEEESEEETRVSSRSRLSRSGGRSQSSNTRSRDRQQHTSGNRNQGSGRSSRGVRASAMDVATPPSRTSRRGPSDLSLCEDILHKIMKNKNSWPFLEPVDKKEVPDYFNVIKKPMDFQTMLKKLARLSYASPQEFIEDAALVFENAEAYNQPDSDVYSCMLEVEKQLKDLVAKVLPDWTYYRTVMDKSCDSGSGSDNGKRKSRNR